MIKEYLELRQSVLSETITINKELYKQGQIEIFEIEKKIDEIENNENDAEKIFSVKTRENTGKKSEEILGLEAQIDAIVIRNKEVRTTYEKAEKELNVVIECLENVSRETFLNKPDTETNDVYTTVETKTNYNEGNKIAGNIEIKIGENIEIGTAENAETVNENKNMQAVNDGNMKDVLRETSGMTKNEITKKLEFCKKIIRTDPKRAYIELENLIKQLHN